MGELNERMTSRELTLWMAFYEAQPRGVERDNYHAAMICTLLANIHAPKGKRFELDDFMHAPQSDKKERETAATLARLRALSTPAD
ncbi:phage tail assembly protein T [Pleionea sediminis]|uniref:phage tail assembly protein T n=1 Tax=Pleionea sediminis TaxID=2569479 RepID=UPI00197BBF36|nr:DUF4035 domain-containing protein [Pleionea sediminis]